MTVTTWKDTGEAALNAVVGDRLDANENVLGIEMALYDRGHRLETLPAGTGKLCVLVHGMACTESCWQFPEHPELDYGRLLEREYGLNPLYVRYNTGLPVWSNGRKLADLMQSVVDDSPVPIEAITLIGHSLGGLVIRSALHQSGGDGWASLVRRAFYVGTPHDGSPLERAGKVTTSVLQSIAEPVTKMLGNLGDQRSAAIKNLGQGHIVETGETIPLAERIEHYVVAGTLPQPVLAAVLGDGLVPVEAATGRHLDAKLGLFEGVHHMDLAHHREVYEWIAGRAGAPDPTEPLPPQVRIEEKKRLEGVLDLLGEAVHEGSSAIQEVHETIASRPYDVLEKIPVLATPTRWVRSGHFAVLRGTYGTIRGVNALLRRPGAR